MISLVICSRTQNISQKFDENIKKTIGCEYELVVIDNSNNQYSIFEAYNLGLTKSKNNFVCFLHDDILIHSNNWGELLIETFKKNPEVGLLGIAGSQIKTKMPSAWFNCPKEQKAIYIIQHFNGQNLKDKWEYGFENSSYVEVTAIDGVFMALRKDPRISFNTNMKGFHNYDLNISFEYQKFGYKVWTTNTILIEHFSNGNMNKEWVESTYKIHTIYKDILPLKTCNMSKIDLKLLEFENGVKYVNHALNFKFKKNAIKIWFDLLKIKPYSKEYIKFSKKMIRLLLE